MLARKLVAVGAQIPADLLADPASDLKPFSIPRPRG
jgi:3-phenylpropionate/trans-cinnamate dioxygenase ferredoxin reductase subunit